MPDADALRGKTILIVEDEYLVADDLRHYLEACGATVGGPAGSVKQALLLISALNARLDAAVLDINLGKERVYPVADKLLEEGVPIVFATGYEELLLAKPYLGVAHIAKPIDKDALRLLLIQAVGPAET